ncbi:cytochrome P450 [Streptomyces hirsutus]|uniref:cytochrome P450 n=1 Tax=Streptomyces hirsutus TaxID=35620 RepID=UPI003630BED5
MDGTVAVLADVVHPGLGVALVGLPLGTLRLPRFGDGRRKCIGENFAWTELQIILSTDLQLWPRMELASRTPRAQAVATVKPDTMTIVLESVRMVIPAVREARRPVRTCCCTIQVGLVGTAASSERNEIRYTVGVADNPVP